MEMVAGRPFSPELGTDSTEAMILNEVAVKQLGYSSPEQILGKRFKQAGMGQGTIIGVMKDFHFRSLQEKITPFAMRIHPFYNRNLLSVDMQPANLPATIAGIEKEWNKLGFDKPFNYEFLDESFDQHYRSEERFGTLFLYFAGLAIFISCLGLLGLASYTALQRTKEIGIRKVLGATVLNVWGLISKDFVRLVGIAFLIAAPAAWYAMNHWLQNFAYRIELQWWMFVLAGLLAIVLALLTVSFQSVKAALMNPVKSLRSE